jgi:hypothetical protein
VNAVARYKLLPESKRIPDAIWELARLEEELERITIERVALEGMINSAQAKALAVLRADWSDSDIQKAGLL